MKKARIIGHLQELDNIRRDEYMPETVIRKVIELEKLLTEYLRTELENPSDRAFDYAGDKKDLNGQQTN